MEVEMRAVMIAVAGMMIATAYSGAETGTPGTVNAVSQSEIVTAKAAISRAGYQPGVLATAQDHNLFFTATKGAETYGITVTPDRKVYVGTAVPMQSTR